MPARPVIGAGRCPSRRTRQFRGAEFAASGRAVFDIADDLGSTALEAFYGAGNTDLPACPQIGRYRKRTLRKPRSEELDDHGLIPASYTQAVPIGANSRYCPQILVALPGLQGPM